MEAILLAKDTLDVLFVYDSLSAGKLYLASDSAAVCKSCAENMCNYNSAICITGIICLTVFALALLGMLFYLLKGRKRNDTPKDDFAKREGESFQRKMQEEQYKELKEYRARLANFLEKQAIEKETICVEKEGSENITCNKGYITRTINSDNGDKYVKKLEEYISALSSNLGITEDQKM